MADGPGAIRTTKFTPNIHFLLRKLAYLHTDIAAYRVRDGVQNVRVAPQQRQTSQPFHVRRIVTAGERFHDVQHDMGRILPIVIDPHTVGRTGGGGIQLVAIFRIYNGKRKKKD